MVIPVNCTYKKAAKADDLPETSRVSPRYVIRITVQRPPRQPAAANSPTCSSDRSIIEVGPGCYTILDGGGRGHSTLAGGAAEGGDDGCVRTEVPDLVRA